MNQIKEYFRNPRISNSLLGMVGSNPRWVKMKQDNPDLEDEEKQYFRLGSALDCLLTSPELFTEEFEIVEHNRPYGLLGKFIDHLPIGLTPNTPLDKYQIAYDKSGYKMKLATVVRKFWENTEAANFYYASKKISGKSILSKDEKERVFNMMTLMEANPYAQDYFDRDKYSTISEVEFRYQLPIYFEYRNQECKALLDGLKVIHEHKVIQPFDLKTTGKHVNDFNISFTQFGYYRQAAFYTEAIRHWQVDNDLVDYSILPFKFIVVSSRISDSHPAIIWDCSENDIQVGLKGGVLKRNKKHYKGIDNLIDDYLWHKENDYWDMPRQVYEAQGSLSLDVFI